MPERGWNRDIYDVPVHLRGGGTEMSVHMSIKI